ncbi:hypothetical protein RJ639_000436 [Escallonia herrerae]|uniref:C3H1-type domain-containing protein n=1 Tax=Escallonia herrerae TaxID=1293975 RepID=A0AA89BF57_9ASTE|nr:hypothetical protein RJ639_000436 [Escallonia herrerae]
MALYASGAAGNGSGEEAEWVQAGPKTGLEESMRRLGLWGRELYPERPGVPDCAYFMRTGSCGYGSKCRFNHPRDHSSVAGALRNVGGDYPERMGEPACQYYLRTGTCKFGASCKFHHPRHAGGSLSNVPLNIFGYPLRPDDKECSYYLKTGQCKFGITCKFHHPQPDGISLPEPARPFYPTVQSSSSRSPEQHYGPSTGYRGARPPLLPGSYVQRAYSTVLLPPGMVPLSNWSPYSGPLSPVLSPGAQHSTGAASVYGVTQLSSPGPTFAGPFSSFALSAGPSSSSERVFPERPGQPECKYYMKTGDCKFGSSCKYHHPPDWATSRENCVLSPLGLPLRPGVQPCTFYLQNGHCKFGHACKFHHPMRTVRYSSSSSLTNIPVAPYMLGSSLATVAPSISFSELRPSLDSHLPREPSAGNTSSSSTGLIFPPTVSVSLSDGHQSGHSSPPMGISRSTR